MSLEHLYNIYWIKSGMQVIHVEELNKPNPTVYYIDRLLRKSLDMIGGEKKVMVIGVLAHWFKKEDGKPNIYMSGRFTTKEFIPKEVFDAGTKEIMKWSQNQSDLKGGSYVNRSKYK